MYVNLNYVCIGPDEEPKQVRNVGIVIISITLTESLMAYYHSVIFIFDVSFV